MSIYNMLVLGCLWPGLAVAGELLVAAASDLSPTEGELKSGFRESTGHDVKFVFQSSGMIARQIQNGAPYDVYLSANEAYVRQLADSGHVIGSTIRIYAVGRLGLWSRQDSIKRLEDLTKPEVRHVAIPNPAHAPYGVAARQALENRGLWPVLQPKIILAENVRQAFQYAESGNADAVITSWTMVGRRGGVMLPKEWHEPVRQAGGVVRGSARQDLAKRFLDYLTSGEGKAVLERHGLAAGDQ